MFSSFNYYSSFISFLYNAVVGLFSYFYLYLLACVLCLFLLYRFPYCYSLYLFMFALVVLVFSSFACLFLSRIFEDINSFFGGFIPVGTPVYICPLVCLAETISYFVRPVVLIIRPFINISIGCFGSVAVCGLCLVSVNWLLVSFVLFFYEVFVAVVHWYIVASILSFSVDH